MDNVNLKAICRHTVSFNQDALDATIARRKWCETLNISSIMDVSFCEAKCILNMRCRFFSRLQYQGGEVQGRGLTGKISQRDKGSGLFGQQKKKKVKIIINSKKINGIMKVKVKKHGCGNRIPDKSETNKRSG